MRILLISGCLLLGCSEHGDASLAGAPDHPNTSTTESAVLGLGTVSGVTTVTCPQGALSGSNCKQVTVSGCPGIESESINATVAIHAASGTLKGTVVHFKGGGGEGFEGQGMNYVNAGFRSVQVSWTSDWEQTQSLGIKTAGCRPSTILKWVFDAPQLHGGSRSLAFCGEGFSGGSGQLGYALAHYGMGDYLDYVNELSGPPFSRIDLGCDGDAPATAVVCGATDTMQLKDKVGAWENIPAPLTCGSTNVPASELTRWQNDSIAVGGTYNYPQTRVEFYDCTNQATAVTAMAKIYFDQISAAEGGDPSLASYHCYSAANGCQGESLGTGNADAVAALIANCVPRHQ